MRFLTSGFFHDSVSPGPLVSHWGFLRKFVEIFTTLSLTPAISCSPVLTRSVINYVEKLHVQIFLCNC
jgi:hypothetical protein